MRQVTLKVLRGRLTEELKNLPFEITRNGRVVGVVIEKGLNLSAKTVKGCVHNTTEAKEKLTAIIKKKQSADKPKAHSSTGVGHFNPCPKQGKK